jgi:membrane protease YdiL (CAAX protease family)
VTKRGGSRAKRQGPQVNPYLGYLLFVGIGFGTWRVMQGTRQLLLWTVLLLAGLLYVEARPIKANYTPKAMGWGALIGAVVGVPVLIFALGPLKPLGLSLYAAADTLQLIYMLVFAAIPAEELYFRGFAQHEVGLPQAVGLYAGAALVFFLPNPGIDLLTVLGMAMAYGVLGFVQGYVYRLHGLSAAMVSRLVISLLLLIVPTLVGLMTAVG